MDNNTQSGKVVLSLSGRLDASNAGEFGEKLTAAVAAPETKHVIVDCATLAYVSSAGLRVLLKAVRELRQRNGTLSLCAVNSAVQEVLKLAGFVSFLSIYPSVDECLKSK